MADPGQQRRGPIERALLRARRRWREGKLATSLNALLEVWQVVPEAELTRAILLLAARLEDRQDLIVSFRHWRHVERRRSAADIARLAATTEMKRTWAQYCRDATIDALAEWPPNPRFASLLGERGTRARRHTERAQPPGEPDAKLPAPGVAALAEILRGLDGAHAEESALLGRVYADGGSDAARLVYADWLLERGRPRGEFITLQYRVLEPSVPYVDQMRMWRLQRRYRDEWMGGLANALTDERWERGFVAAASLTPDAVGAIGAPDWATLRELSVRTTYNTVPPRPAAQVLTQPSLAGLRAVTLDAAVLLELVRLERPLPVERLELDWDPRRQDHDPLVDTEIFPRLRELVVGWSPAAYQAWLPRSRMGSGLMRLQMPVFRAAGELLALARALPTVEEIAIGSERWLRWRRGDGGRFSIIHATNATNLRRLVTEFAADLDEVTEIELREGFPMAEDRAAVEQVAAQQRRWRLTIV